MWTIEGRKAGVAKSVPSGSWVVVCCDFLAVRSRRKLARSIGFVQAGAVSTRDLFFLSRVVVLLFHRVSQKVSR